MRTVRITVAGQTFHIKSDAAEEHLAKLAEEVDARFRELKRGTTRGDQDVMVMSMVAVSLLDELRRAAKQHEAQAELTRKFAVQLIEKIDALLMQDMS